jgi:hypothetical protein
VPLLEVRELLSKYDVIRKPLGNERPEFTFDAKVDLRDEIDGPLLVDVKLAAEMRHLNFTGAYDRLDRGGEKNGRERIRHRLPAS